MRAWHAGTVLVALLCGAATARADGGDATVGVAWTSRDGCLDTAMVEAAVGARTRRALRPAGEADAVISGAATARSGGGWQVDLIVMDRRRAEVLGRRALDVASSDCAALRDHVALVMAMLADSSVVEPAAVAPVDDAEAPPREVVERRWSAAIAVGGAVEAGRLPGVAPAWRASVGAVTPGGWSVELRAAAFAAASAEREAGEASLAWRIAAVIGCVPGWSGAGWRATACAGLEVGTMDADGAGFARNADARELLIDGIGAVRVERRIAGPVSVCAEAAIQVAARRPRFGYEDEAGTFRGLYRPRVVGAVGGAGVVVRF